VLIFFEQPKRFKVDTYLNENWPKGIGIINGFTKSEVLYKANNRAKDIEVKLYKMGIDFVQGTEDLPKGSYILVDLKLLEQTNITLNDDYLSENRLPFSINLETDYVYFPTIPS
jgi:hypothetical protein